MWYRFAMLSVMSSSFSSSCLSWCMRATSSIHSRHPVVVWFHTLWFPLSFDLISFSISSIRAAYSMNDSTPPWRMLSFMCIFLVSPWVVLIFAVRLLSRFFYQPPVFILVFHFCVVHIVWHSAMLCHMLLLRLGRLCIGVVW